MRTRAKKVPFLLYPEAKIKEKWEFLILVVLIVSCIITPYRIAFSEIKEPLEWKFVNYLIDLMFFIDILVIFDSAFYD